MGSSITRSHLSPSFLFAKPVNFIPSTPSNIQLNPSKNPPISRFAINYPKSRKPNPKKSPINNHHHLTFPTKSSTTTVSEKVKSLDFEFKSLPEPIDRVRKLLHYAAILPPFDESSRIQENRVFGCTTQVWLEARMESNGAMRFSLDSDSEITKGFCSCLIWLLDGAHADDVLSVKTEDLVEMNVGLPSRGNSRVNTWHNVLIGMQRRTVNLVEHHQSLDPLFSSCS
ncbi:hypothetical protein ACP275_05G021100 [Erythranthe tilingii]